MIAYVKIEFILILVLVGELRSYKMTIGPSDTDTGQSLKKWTFDLPMSQCPQGGMSLRATRIGLP